VLVEATITGVHDVGATLSVVRAEAVPVASEARGTRWVDSVLVVGAPLLGRVSLDAQAPAFDAQGNVVMGITVWVRKRRFRGVRWRQLIVDSSTLRIQPPQPWAARLPMCPKIVA
jgi:hypothetical protein